MRTHLFVLRCPGGGVMDEQVPINNPSPSHSLSGVQRRPGEDERTSFNEVRRPGSATGQTHTRLRCCGAQHARVPDVVRSRLRPCVSSHVSFMFVYHLMLS